MLNMRRAGHTPVTGYGKGGFPCGLGAGNTGAKEIIHSSQLSGVGASHSFGP